MDEAIDRSGGGHGIFEDPSPIAEEEVGGQEDALALVALLYGSNGAGTWLKSETGMSGLGVCPFSEIVAAGIEHRLAAEGVTLPELTSDEAADSLLRNRRLMSSAREYYGDAFAERVGSDLAEGTSHPFVGALIDSNSPATLFARWTRLEILAQSYGHFEAATVEPHMAHVHQRHRRGGAPSLEQDEVVMCMLVGVLKKMGFASAALESKPSSSEDRPC
jgi:hypothetical protein